MASISVDQRFAFLAALGANIDWNALTPEQVQAGIDNPKNAGTQATLFIQIGYQVQIGEFFRDTNELTVELPALKRPTLQQLRKKYDWIKSIERDTSTEEAVTLTLSTVLVPDDGSYIEGKEYEKRIATKHDKLLGFQHMEWLLEHQSEFPRFMALLGKIYIDFPGIVVVDGDGRRAPCCDQDGSRWVGHWRWLDDRFDSGERIASRK